MGRICYSTILNLCRVLTQGQYVGGRQVVCRSQLSSSVLPVPGSFHVRPWDPEAIFSHFLPTRLLVAVISYSFRSHRPTEKKKNPQLSVPLSSWRTPSCFFHENKSASKLLVLVFIQQNVLGVSTLCPCLGALPLFCWGLQLDPFPSPVPAVLQDTHWGISALGALELPQVKLFPAFLASAIK